MSNKRGRSFLKFSEAITTLVGTIIGAGVLAIPYAMMKAGFLTGLLNITILSISVIFLYLYIGEIVLRTKGNYQLTGYAQRYLGNKGKKIMTLSMILGIYGALTAYLLGIGQSIATIFGLENHIIKFFGISLPLNIGFSLLFFIFGTFVIYLGVKSVGKSELVLSSTVILIVLCISLLLLPTIKIRNIINFNIYKIFLPYGVILFALAGAVAIPEMKEELENKKRLLKKAIVIGTLIPIILYIIFSLAVVGNCGDSTSEIATICIGDKFGFLMLLFGNIFAIFAMSTSFLTLGLALKEMYNYDYCINKKLSLILACFIPLILFFLLLFFIKQERFFNTIGLTGGIAMTLEGIMIVLMFKKAKKRGNRKPEYEIKRTALISVFLIIIFLLGMLYTILNALGIIF